MVDSPGQFSEKIFEVENGHVAITLEKFPRAREKGVGILRQRGWHRDEERDERVTFGSVKAAE